MAGINDRVSEVEIKMALIEKKMNSLYDSQEKCFSAIEKLATETTGLVDVYKQANSLIKVGSNVQKFATWVAKWPLIGAGIYAIYEYLTKINH